MPPDQPKSTPAAASTRLPQSPRARWAALLAAIAATTATMVVLFGDNGAQIADHRSDAARVPDRTCLEWDADPPSIQIFDESIRRAHVNAWRDACRHAVTTDSSARMKRAYGRVLMATGKRDEALPQFRAAAAENDMEAWLEIHQLYRSWERDRPIEKQLVRRAEAEQALREAAGLGSPRAILTLAVSLERGDMVKRDISEAILWAQRIASHPPKDWSAQDAQVMLGRVLVKSANASDRARGMTILSALPRGDAKAELALAIRAEQPERARALLEDALRSYPGHAVGPLADMLIKGEGGPADPKRAVSLLQGKAHDVGLVKAELGKLYLEGKLVPRNVDEAARLIAQGAQWDYDLRLLLASILADNPVSIGYPKGLLASLAEAVEVGEPGAMSALIGLKLSAHPQFSDKAGGCALIQQARAAGIPASEHDTSACPRI